METEIKIKRSEHPPVDEFGGERGGRHHTASGASQIRVGGQFIDTDIESTDEAHRVVLVTGRGQEGVVLVNSGCNMQ